MNTEKKVRERMPLYHKGPGEVSPRAAYLEIDLETGEVQTRIEDPRGEHPPRVLSGLVRRVYLSPYTLKEALEEFLESEEAKGLVKKVLEGARVYLDGWMYVGELTEEAQEALEELADLAADLPQGFVWDPESWFLMSARYDEKTGLYYIEDIAVTLDNLEELYKRFPEEWEEEGTVRFAPGLHGYLREVAMESEGTPP